jgi:acyl-CoA synthetase (AMP-forming)/AMP-acid ligase II
MQSSRADHSAAHDLLARNVSRAAKVAYIDAASGAQLTYGELAEQSHRFANALRGHGFVPESRMLLAMLDTLEWPVVFLGCILAGVVPVAANTLLTAKDFDFMLRDSRAHGLVVSAALRAKPPARPSPNWCGKPLRRRRWRRPAATTPVSGSIPAAAPARPRARCTCTAT